MSAGALARLKVIAGDNPGVANTRNPRLICLGLTSYDMVWSVQELPAGKGKVRASSFHQGGGGMAANAAVAAARLGAAVQYWGRAGDDRAGVTMRDELAAENVDVSWLRLISGGESSVSSVLVDSVGERAIVNFRGAGLPTDPQWLPLVEAATAHAVLADPRWPEGAVAMFDAARISGVATVLDGDVAEPAVFDRLLPSTDYAIFSQPGLVGFASRLGTVEQLHPASHDSSPDFAEIRRQLCCARDAGCTIPAVTLGADGVAWLDDTGLNHMPAHAVDATDTTGAGDIFHGATAFAIGAGLALEDAFALATAVAAIKCLKPGGRAGAPDLCSTLNWLKQCGKRT